jgi:hypothetical protein
MFPTGMYCYALSNYHYFYYIRGASLFFVFLFFSIRLFDWPITKKKKKKETFETSKNKSSCVKIQCFHLAHLYRWEGENFLQTIGDKIEEVSREGTKIPAKGENEKVQNSTKSFCYFTLS